MLAETGWLPEPLRAADPEADADIGTEAASVTLPAFLTEDTEDTEANEEADAATRPGAGEVDPQGMAAE